MDPLSPVECRLALNRSVPVPLWSQIETYLADTITAGRLHPGEPLGSEAVLADSFCVGRSVIRQALRELDRRGLVARNRTYGTRVSEQAVAA